MPLLDPEGAYGAMPPPQHEMGGVKYQLAPKKGLNSSTYPELNLINKMFMKKTDYGYFDLTASWALPPPLSKMDAPPKIAIFQMFQPILRKKKIWYKKKKLTWIFFGQTKNTQSFEDYLSEPNCLLYASCFYTFLT